MAGLLHSYGNNVLVQLVSTLPSGIDSANVTHPVLAAFSRLLTVYLSEYCKTAIEKVFKILNVFGYDLVFLRPEGKILIAFHRVGT